MDYQLNAQQLCARNNLKFLSCELVNENKVYVRGISHGQWGEVWCMEYTDGASSLNQRVLRFDLFGDIEIPLAILDDAHLLAQYMASQGKAFREREVDGEGEIA